MMPYCGCAGDCLAAGVWCVLLTVALCGLVHVELMFSDGGLDGAIVLGRRRVRVRMRVRMRMRMGGRELGGNAVLGRGCKLGWWVGLGHGWIRGSRCVLVTLQGERQRFSVTLFAWRLNTEHELSKEHTSGNLLNNCNEHRSKQNCFGFWVKIRKVHTVDDNSNLKSKFTKWTRWTKRCTTTIYVTSLISVLEKIHIKEKQSGKKTGLLCRFGPNVCVIQDSTAS